MSKAIHLRVCYQTPNESDTQGDYGLACGKEYDNPRVTEYPHLVTCVRCKKAMNSGDKE